MTRYKQAVAEMLEQNKEIFDKFRVIHEKYTADPGKWQSEYNEEGSEISNILRRAENKLCSKSERSSYGKYSSQLAEKFRREIRNYFPKIDFIGVKIDTPAEDSFSLQNLLKN